MQKFFKNDNEKKYREEMEKNAKTKRKDPETSKTSDYKAFQKFIKSKEVTRKRKEWKRKWKFTERGINEVLLILWLNDSKKSEKGILKSAQDILSKLKGQDLFAKFLNVLKLTPEDKMS